MLDFALMRATLAGAYDLAPSLEKAEATADIHARMDRVVPLADWARYAPYVLAINRLKRDRGAVILAHNYMTPEIFHGVADVMGDSLQLAIEATRVEADVIVQCGVHFMAETSKILEPVENRADSPTWRRAVRWPKAVTAEGVAEIARPIPRARRWSAMSTPPPR